MNDEIAQLRKRIAELERINGELTRENSALKAKPQKEIPQGGDRSSQILQFFCANTQVMTASQVATRFNLTQSATQYHLDHLVAIGFLTLSRRLGTGEKTIGYAITPQGRAVVTGQ